MKEIVAVLEKIVDLLRRPDTNVAWSHYRDAEDALADMNQHIAKLRGGDTSSMSSLKLLFAPTGPLQEIAISNHWGTEFLSLTIRFDEALVKTSERRTS